MRILGLALGAVLFSGALAVAQSLPPHAMRVMAPIDPASAFHIAGASLTPMVLAEWDEEARGGKTVRIVWGQEAVTKAPVQASRYSQKTYTFPTGTIRVLDFKKSQGGMIHMITSETGLFVLAGRGTVEVGGKTVDLTAGDAVSYPSGVLRGSGDATVIAWTVTGQKINADSKAMVVRAGEAPVTESAEWEVEGKRVRVNTAEGLKKAPADAIRLAVKRYDFDGNSVRVANSKQGGPTSPSSGTMDSLIYVTSGKLRFYQNDQMVEAVPGDAIREIAGATHYWYRIEDSSFVATSSMPVVPATVTPPSVAVER